MAVVVCIEDEVEMLELMTLILQRNGFEVVAATTGNDGWQKVKELRPSLVLLDLMMPDIDGWQVYEQMKLLPETQAIPVIIVTARAQNSEKTVALRVAKVDDYLVKPFAPAQLIESVQRVLAKQVGKPN
jgi:two-component system, OmpR family, response regulator VicR